MNAKSLFIFCVFTLMGLPSSAEKLLPPGSKVMDVQAWHFNRPGYLGVLFRPAFCASGCAKSYDGAVMSFGLEAGYKYWGVGFRYAYKAGGHYVIPDLRFLYPVAMGRRFFLEPLFELSPIFWTGGSSHSMQLTLRPGVRIRFQVSPGFGIYLEPVLLDFVVHAWVWGNQPKGMGGFIFRYTAGFGLQYRFK